jgi:hypothetical protein
VSQTNRTAAGSPDLTTKKQEDKTIWISDLETAIPGLVLHPNMFVLLTLFFGPGNFLDQATELALLDKACSCSILSYPVSLTTF